MNMTQRELYHHGILGMKWGKRQGPPYPLDAEDHSANEKKEGYRKSLGGGRNEELYDRKAEKEKKKISNKYKSLAVKAQREVVNSHNYVKAYNKAVNKINNGIVDKYNSDYENELKKAGIDTDNYDYANDKKYYSGYENIFNEIFEKEYEQVIAEALQNNKNYKKARELVDKYSMKDWDDLARDNEEYMNEIINKIKK